MSLTTEHKNIWEDALTQIEQEVSKANFNTWFKDTFINKINDGVAQIGVPNSFVRDWLNNKFYKTILKNLRGVSEEIRAIDIVVSKNNKKEVLITKKKTEQSNTELPLADFYINKENNLNPRYIFETFVIGPFNELAHAATQAV
jgi:chromosomal replication initiator protein